MGTEALAMAGPMAGPIKGVAWLIPYCARPASTLSTPARNDQFCVRDARARGISLAAPPFVSQVVLK
ncbi:MAG: hypothetical protein AUH74_05010 [Nitrospirae bacterium 13_1_40CM_4_62_6]|nr:MAG: hypothetical protein AUH74_05010 [Nitrospirae bacterium 13_1_40CM_4_62_6]